jgi:hypothetical protein
MFKHIIPLLVLGVVSLSENNINGKSTEEIAKEIDWVDLVVGARWTTPINKDWKFSLLG